MLFLPLALDNENGKIHVLLRQAVDFIHQKVHCCGMFSGRIPFHSTTVHRDHRMPIVEVRKF